MIATNEFSTQNLKIKTEKKMFNECSTIARHLRVFDWVIRVNLNVYINKLYVTSRLFINSKQLVPLGVFTKRRTSQIKAYFTSLLRLSYSCRIKNRSGSYGCRKTSPYGILKSYGSRIVANQFLHKSTFAAKFAQLF